MVAADTVMVRRSAISCKVCGLAFLARYWKKQFSNAGATTSQLGAPLQLQFFLVQVIWELSGGVRRGRRGSYFWPEDLGSVVRAVAEYSGGQSRTEGGKEERRAV